MNRIQVWTHAARPKTLVASISPAFIGLTLAISQGFFNMPVFLITLITGMSIQIGTNLVNDYFDFIKGADTAERKGFMRVTQAGLVSAASMKRAILATFILAALCGCYLIWVGGLGIAVMLALFILLSVLYTAGPYPLAYLGLGDLLVLFLYGPAAVLITYYLQTGTLSKEAFLAGVAPGAFSMAILVVNNVRDIEEDRKANKKTLPARFGKTFGKCQYLFALALALMPLLFLYSEHPFALLALLILFPALPLIRFLFNYKDPRELNQLFGKTGQLLWLFTLLFCVGWML
ncbi:MAG: 1,4-dihydroxy-2-naphthoate polyprenyltransferase [Candidatus Melainabacteria bacterium]|nr:1,4-dihydroxy-2-naphthoate polyprenyltransferase [Candidatus Melainabacteria bacterium]